MHFTAWKLFKRCRLRLPKGIGQRLEGLFLTVAEAAQFIGPDVKGEESEQGSSMVFLSPAGRGNLAEGGQEGTSTAGTGSQSSTPDL